MLNFNKSREGLEKVSVSLAPTLISGSVHCRGHLSGNADVVVEGEFSGTIRIGGRLIIRPGGRVHSEGIECRIADISGEADGIFYISELLYIRQRGVVSGDVAVGGIRIEEGGAFNGNCKTVVSANPLLTGATPDFPVDRIPAVCTE